MQTNQHNPNHSHPRASSHRLLAAVGAAVTLAAAALPSSAPAQDGRVGNDAPRQERNPSQRPELFTLAAARDQRQVVARVTTAAVAAAAPRTPAKTQRRAFVAATSVVVVTTAPAPTTSAPRGADMAFETLVGSNAPRQERNPSAHPELWSR